MLNIQNNNLIKEKQLNFLEKALGEYYKQNFYAFVNDWFLDWKGTPFKPHYTVQQVCEFAQLTIEGEFERLLVSLPRGWGKSIIISEALSAWALLKDPTERIGCFSRALTEDAKMWHESAIKILKLPKTLKYFKDFSSRLASESKIILRTKAGGYRRIGSCLSSSVGSDMTLAIIDDPADQEHYRSLAKRTRLENFLTKGLLRAVRTTNYELDIDQLTPTQKLEYELTRALESEINSNFIKRKPRLILTMQRLHVNDPVSIFLRMSEEMEKAGIKSNVRYLSIPAIHEHKTSYYFPISKTEYITENNEYTLAGTLSKESIEKAKIEMLPEDFEAQFQQNPIVSQGALMKDHDFLFYDEKDLQNEMQYIFMTCDTANKTGTANDYSVMCCWAWNGVTLFLLDMVRGKWDFVDLQKVFNAFYNKWKYGLKRGKYLSFIFVEDKASGTQLLQTATSLNLPRGMLRAKQRTQDKYSRYALVGGFIANQKVSLPHFSVQIDGVQDVRREIVNPFLDEVKNFTKDNTHAHDDICDCLFDACEFVFTKKQPKEGQLLF